MIPKLFQIGPIAIYSYGLMMGIAFIVANLILTRELKRRGLSPSLSTAITMISLVGGVAGSKLFFLLENPEEFRFGVFRAIFSPAGLTFYGGLIVVAISLIIYFRRKRLSFLRIADAIAPALIIAYGIGRIGCLLAGDGDYGTPTQLPWGMTFAHGTAKPAIELREYFLRHPEMDSVYHYSTLSTQLAGRDDFGFITKFDQSTPLHPTPLYETLYSLAIFGILMLMRDKTASRTGRLFALYCMLAGGARFAVEFLRLNPLYAGLSLSQWIGGALVLAGAILWVAAKPAMKRITLTMLSKDQCSLCDTMLAMLEPLRGPLAFDVTVIKMREGDEWWNEYSDKVPVLLLDGSMMAKYRITADELEKRLREYRERVNAA